MTPRQMQVDAGGFQIGMVEENLDGRQIGAVLQQMRGETVSEDIVAVPMISMRQRFGIAITLCMA